MMRLSLIWYEWFKDSEKGGLGDGKPIYTLDVQSGKKSFSKNHFSIFQKSNSSFHFFKRFNLIVNSNKKLKRKLANLPSSTWWQLCWSSKVGDFKMVFFQDVDGRLNSFVTFSMLKSHNQYRKLYTYKKCPKHRFHHCIFWAF